MRLCLSTATFHCISLCHLVWNIKIDIFLLMMILMHLAFNSVVLLFCCCPLPIKLELHWYCPQWLSSGSDGCLQSFTMSVQLYIVAHQPGTLYLYLNQCRLKRLSIVCLSKLDCVVNWTVFPGFLVAMFILLCDKVMEQINKLFQWITIMALAVNWWLTIVWQSANRTSRATTSDSVVNRHFTFSIPLFSVLLCIASQCCVAHWEHKPQWQPHWGEPIANSPKYVPVHLNCVNCHWFRFRFLSTLSLSLSFYLHRIAQSFGASTCLSLVGYNDGWWYIWIFIHYTMSPQWPNLTQLSDRDMVSFLFIDALVIAIPNWLSFQPWLLSERNTLVVVRWVSNGAHLSTQFDVCIVVLDCCLYSVSFNECGLQ